MPGPTAWPIVVAAGLALSGAGLLTSYVFCGLGLLVATIGLAGWITQLYPGAGRLRERMVPPDRRPRPIEPSRRKVQSLGPGMPGHRAMVPTHRHPYTAGLKGGVVGGIVMAGCALLYGVVSSRTIWYPINLLAAMVLPRFGTATVSQLEQFSVDALVLGLVIHGVASLAAGFVMAVVMPMLPAPQAFWSSIVAPVLWTGVVYGFMTVLNPVMNQYVDWWWFVGSQFAFGIAASVVIVRSEKVKAWHGS
jgi:hypothetical protein